MADIHPTSIVEEGAKLHESVKIGPYCTVGPNVNLAQDVELMSHVVLTGYTDIGENTKIYPFAALGLGPQHSAYKGEEVRLIIGKNNVIREHVTMHPGTTVDKLETRVGDDGLFMVGSHVAHDCVVGNNVIFANNATLGGHVSVGDYVMVGGLAAIHQHCRIGQHAFVGGMAAVPNDVIPFGSVQGNHAHLAGLNLVGLRRRGFSRETIHTLRNAYRLLFAWEGRFQERIDDVAEEYGDCSEVMDIIDFIRTGTNRPICMPKFDPD